jgi:AraC family transcriptional regulator
MRTTDPRGGLSLFDSTVRSRVVLPGLEVSLFRYSTPDSHDTLLDASDEFQLGYIFDGDDCEKYGSFPEIRSAARFAPLGDLYLVPPDTPFRTHCAPLQTSGVQCLMAKARFEDLWEASFESWNRDQFEASLNIRDPEINRLMRQLVRELTGRSRGREMAVDYLVSLTLIQAGRHLDARRFSLGMLPAWQIRRVEDMVREQADAGCSMQDIARACGISPSHLMRGYKKTTGHTIGKLIETVRIERAKSLLRDSRASIGEIAVLLGFSSQPHFSSAFHRAEGMTPRQFRQQIVGGSSAARIH